MAGPKWNLKCVNNVNFQLLKKGTECPETFYKMSGSNRQINKCGKGIYDCRDQNYNKKKNYFIT